MTGGSGFIGSAVVRHLLAADKRVRVLARSSTDRRNLDGLPIEIAEGDLLDSASLAAAIQGCDALYHLAADYRLWARDPRLLYRTNVDGTAAVMRAAVDAGVQRVVYTSSVAVLATVAGDCSVDEDTPVTFDDMIGHYKRSKYLAEDLVRAMVASHGLPAVIVNPSAPVGPRDARPTPTGRFIVEAASGRIPAYVDTGLNIVHVDDVAAGHLLAFENGKIGERYILGGQNMTLGRILATIADLRGFRRPRLKLPHGAIAPLAYVSEAAARLTGREPFVTVDGARMARKPMYFSSAKAERALGHFAKPAEVALRDAVDWFAKHGYLR